MPGTTVCPILGSNSLSVSTGCVSEGVRTVGAVVADDADDAGGKVGSEMLK